MKFVAKVCGNEVGQGYIHKAVLAKQLPQSQLWIGPQHVGKTTLAYNLAFQLLCRQAPTITPCLRCEHCRMISRDIHPNVQVILPNQNGSIGIDQVRELLGSVPQSNWYKSGRLIIIEQADTLTPEAATALLKAIEEPRLDCFWLLLSDQPDKILATLRSRCSQLWWQRVTDATIVAHFPAAKPYVSLIAGLPGQVEQYTSTSGATTLATINQWIAFCLADTYYQRLTVAKKLLPKTFKRSDLINPIYQLTRIAHDLLLLHYQAPEHIHAQTAKSALIELQQKTTIAQTVLAIDILKKIRSYIQRPVQAKIVFDYVTISLYR
ncbi:MAG: AAA family ATPase [Candidatus Kerfeldbacteria bacterium]|nr:AAA family ATPase [Candidatus Kerfeldbacteria bacterium]